MTPVQWGLVAYQNRRLILGCLGALVFLIVGFVVVFVGTIVALPMNPDHLTKEYKDVAAGFKAPDGSSLPLDWEELRALDAARFGNDFSHVDRDSIEQLASLFVRSVKGPKGVTYELRQPEEIFPLLNMTAEQIEVFHIIQGVARFSSAAQDGVFRPGPGARYIWPVEGQVTEPFGLRISPTPPFEQEFHTGVDIAASTSTPIKAPTAGVIHLTAWAGGYGKLTVFVGDDGMVFWFGHQSEWGAKVGQHLAAGEVLGYVGSTGRSTGPHLHFEARPGGGNPVDPLGFYR